MTVPMAAKGATVDLVGSPLVPTLVTLTTTYVQSSMVKIGLARKIALYCWVDAQAVSNEASLLFMVSGEDTQPATVDADVWFAPSLAAEPVAQQLAAGATTWGGSPTKAPLWASTKMRGLEIRHEPTVNANDKLRIKVSLVVEDAKWFQLIYADVGAGATKANLGVRYFFYT